MKRDRATAILRRMLSAIDTGGVPVPINSVWVFGSYARGARDLGDIDLIILHEPMSATLRARLAAESKCKNLDFLGRLLYPNRRYESMIKTPLRRPGEAVDMVLGSSLEEVFSRYSLVKESNRVCLWSKERRDWERALASIKPDPEAQRSSREEFMPAKEAGCSWEEMRWLTKLIDARIIAVERIEPPEWPLRLSPVFQKWTDWWIECKAMGRKSLECLPLGMWWLSQARPGKPMIFNVEIYDEKRTRRVTFGRLHPYQIVWFLDQKKTVDAAHVLHFKRNSARTLLVFKRGKAWAQLRNVEKRLMRDE